MEPHRPIPNSEVKRCSGEDTLRVASRDNSSMPELFLSSYTYSLFLTTGLLHQSCRSFCVLFHLKVLGN